MHSSRRRPELPATKSDSACSMHLVYHVDLRSQCTCTAFLYPDSMSKHFECGSKQRPGLSSLAAVGRRGQSAHP